MAAIAVAIRLPAAIHQCGGQDEDYFAVAGWTLLQTGVPSIPYAPSLNERGVFYKANEILYALPPGFFFAEAAVFKLFGPSYAAGRLTSLLAGAAAIVGVFHLGSRWLRPTSALLAAAIFAFSRPFLFPATTARPDMLCTALLIWAFVVMTLEKEPAAQARVSRLPSAASGVLLGFALLTHPFALLGVLLAVGWIAFSKAERKPLQLLLLLVASAVAFALWLPLIAKDPALFRIQFGNNVLNRAGPGLFQRLIWPWETLAYQAKLFFELAGPWQATLFGFSLVFASGRAIFDRRPKSLFAPRKDASANPAFRSTEPFAERKATLAPRQSEWLWLAWASVLGLAILQGIHPSKGYWSFPTVFLCIAVAHVVERVGMPKRQRGHVAVKLFAAIVAIGLLIPGGGWKAAAVYVRHWGDPAYSHQRDVAELLGKLPPKSRYLVDVGCVFDWHLDGRKTMLALDLPLYYSSAGEPFDFLIVTRTGLEQNLPSALGATERIFQLGDRTDDLAVYIEVWKR